MERVWSEAPARIYLHRAADAVDTVIAELSGEPLNPEAREELALSAAALMGRLEVLLSTLRQNGSPGPAPPLTGPAAGASPAGGPFR
jgi:hypothetical protein